MLKQTRKEAVLSCAKQWEWIAKQYLNGYTYSVEELKDQYIEKKGIKNKISNSCFACQYNTSHIKQYCSFKCIVPLFSKRGSCLFRLFDEYSFSICDEMTNNKEKYNHCIQIANSCREETKRLNNKEKSEI